MISLRVGLNCMKKNTSKFLVREEIFYLLLSLGYLVVLFSLSPVFSANESHYLSVAWQMYQAHHYLFPIQDGLPFAEKPPLLFWVSILFWHVFGVFVHNDLIVRLVNALGMVFTLSLTYRLFNYFFPKSRGGALLSVLILLTFPTWFYHLALFRFESLLTFFSFLAVWCFISFMERGGKVHLTLIAVSVALGILSKGPVILLYTVPFFLILKVWWFEKNKCINRRFVLSIVFVFIGLIFSLIWVVPSCYGGGAAYCHALFYRSTVVRMAGGDGFTYLKKFPYYFYALPGFILPTSVFLCFSSYKKNLLRSKSIRVILYYVAFFLITFSFISQKADRYLLPLFPYLAILSSYIFIDNLNVKRLSIIGRVVFLIFGVLLLLVPMLSQQLYLQKFQLSHTYLIIIPSMLMLLAAFSLSFKDPYYFQKYYACLFITMSFVSVYLSHEVAELSAQNKIGNILSSFENSGYKIGYIKNESRFEYVGKLSKPTRLFVSLKSAEKWSKNENKYCILYSIKEGHRFKHYYLTCKDRKQGLNFSFRAASI